MLTLIEELLNIISLSTLKELERLKTSIFIFRT